MTLRVLWIAALLGACSQAGDAVDENDAVFAGIGENERIEFLGNELFWGGHAVGGSLTYTTPENIEGRTFSVERFAGNNGLGISGQLDGQPFDMTITPGDCSDTMSDRNYPYTVTLQVGGEIRFGCAWTADEPFAGDPAP